MSGASEAGFRERLKAQLDAFAERGLTARFWWRDDDAVDPTPALDRLLALANRYRIEVGIAAIPRMASDKLAERLADEPLAVVLQHGWQHANHQRKDLGEKAAELGSRRERDEALDELRRGRERLETLFGDRFAAVLVPPWNRICDELADAARDRGYAALSTFGGLRADDPFRLQTHVDMIRWKRGRDFIGWQAAAERMEGELRARLDAPREPIGVLSHHLAMDEPSFQFLEAVLTVTSGHPGAEWPEIRSLLGP